MSADIEGPTFEAALEAVRSEAAKRHPPVAESATETGGEAEAAATANPESVRPEGTPGAVPANTEPERPQADAPQADGAKNQPPESAPVDSGLKRLLDREAAIQAREKELGVLEGAKRKFKYDPVAAIRAIAPDASLSEIANALWVEELGDLAPPEAKQKREVRGVKSEVEELRAQIQEERSRLAEESSRQQGELAMNQYAGAIRSTVADVDASKHPLVKSFHKKHSDGVVDEMLTIARTHAQSAGEILTPGQLVDKLEAYLGRYQVVEPVPVATQEDTPPAQTTTLRNQHTQTQPGLQPANELDDEYLRTQALKAVHADRKRRGIG